MATTASFSSFIAWIVIVEISPVMPSASEISSRSLPENSFTVPSASTTRAETTLSPNQPDSNEPIPAPPWASQPPTVEPG